MSEEWTSCDIPIGVIRELLESGYDVEVDSPDGWVGVSAFVLKGHWDEYILRIDDDGTYIRCNENHLFETTVGWRSAMDLFHLSSKFHVLTKTGYKLASVMKTGEIIPIVDIQVDHDNHRYYTNGVSSHNTAVGKSLAMCHMAAANLTAGKNVLYITLEMSEEKIAERIDANLLNFGTDELATLPRETYVRKIARLRSKTVGKLIIKEYPTATAHVGHFRHLLNELNLKRNFVPDIIYVDYLNICTSSRIRPGSNVNTYSFVKSIAEELRGLAVEKNVPLVSATQTNRTGYSNSDPTLSDTSESFGLPATADFMVALVSSEELEEQGQIMVKQLKNRYNDPSYYRKFVVGVDRAKMRLYDVDEEEQTLSDSPVMDNTGYGERRHEEETMKWSTKKMGRKDFSNLKT